MELNTWIMLLSYISQFVVQAALTLLFIGFYMVFEVEQPKYAKKKTKNFFY